MDGVAKEQRQKLETIEAELADVKRRLVRLYDLAETTDLDIDDFKPRIRDHRERQKRLEATAAEARAMLSQRREVLRDVETITAYGLDVRVFLNESELTERRAVIGELPFATFSSYESDGPNDGYGTFEFIDHEGSREYCYRIATSFEHRYGKSMGDDVCLP